ncbi:DUF342 domain-containing protein [bacterium]|nr:DUF342 domain-containing protein [bacterium]
MGFEPGDVKVEVSADKMQASITLLNERVRDQITEDSIRSALIDKQVIAGIDEERIKQLAANPVFNVPQVVAQGQRAVDGKNETVEYKFPVSTEKSIEETATGSLDFRSISNFVSMRANELLAVKQPPTLGTSGYTVLGDELKARDGRTINLRVGKGARLSDDGLSAISTTDGHACLIADRITVQNTVEVPAHVDYSVGNIKFIGNVKIRGNVMPDFTVEAEGDVEIAGNVEQATIKCGGDLNIRGIIFGQGQCEIDVVGNAMIGAIDQATVRVKGNLQVNNYVRHSNVAVGGLLEVQAKKGNIVGGDIHCYRGIESPYIGNNMATLTKLTVGSNPFVSQENEALEAKFSEIDKQLKQIRAAISAMHDRYPPGSRTSKTEEMITKLENTRSQLEPAAKALNDQIQQNKAQSSDFKEAKIKVSQIIYPGVIVSFRDRMQYKTQDEQQRLCFYEEAAEIRTGPF